MAIEAWQGTEAGGAANGLRVAMLGQTTLPSLAVWTVML